MSDFVSFGKIFNEGITDFYRQYNRTIGNPSTPSEMLKVVTMGEWEEICGNSFDAIIVGATPDNDSIREISNTSDVLLIGTTINVPIKARTIVAINSTIRGKLVANTIAIYGGTINVDRIFTNNLVLGTHEVVKDGHACDAEVMPPLLRKEEEEVKSHIVEAAFGNKEPEPGFLQACNLQFSQPAIDHEFTVITKDGDELTIKDNLPNASPEMVEKLIDHFTEHDLGEYSDGGVLFIHQALVDFKESMRDIIACNLSENMQRRILAGMTASELDGMIRFAETRSRIIRQQMTAAPTQNPATAAPAQAPADVLSVDEISQYIDDHKVVDANANVPTKGKTVGSSNWLQLLGRMFSNDLNTQSKDVIIQLLRVSDDYRRAVSQLIAEERNHLI